MKYLIRYYYWIILSWVILVLVFFKFFNNFYFQNNESILFIFLILIVPIIITIIRKVVHKKNMNYFLKIKTNYFEYLEKQIKKELVEELNKITNTNIVGNHIYFGNNLQGLIIYNEVVLEIKILDTFVSYKYYYGKTLEELALFDRYGFENKDPNVLINEVLLQIKGLLNKELVYKEYRKGKKIYSSKLISNDVLKFSYCSKWHKNIEKYNYNKIIIL